MGVVISNGETPSSKDVTGVSVLEEDDESVDTKSSASVVDDRYDLNLDLDLVAIIEE